MSNDFKYITIEDCIDNLFEFAVDFDVNEKTPPYIENLKGVQSLIGILENAKNSEYYPGFFNKIAYLMVSINNGHNS